MQTFDLAGARQATANGTINEWLVALLRREPGANRSLAAIIKGQNPLFTGPSLVRLSDFERISGPEPDRKYPKDPAQWEREIAPMLAATPEALPPILVRYGRELSDGNHRVDAWRHQGLTHGWAIEWNDRDPAFENWWGPFAPERTPNIVWIEPKLVRDFLPPVEDDGLVLAAMVGDQVVGAVRLVPEFGHFTLRTMKVAETYRGFRLGARLLHHLRPQMDGRTVYCLTFPWLSRFYGEFGFESIDADELPAGLRERYASFQDAKGCTAMRRIAE